jgi:hypothetical protein
MSTDWDQLRNSLPSDWHTIGDLEELFSITRSTVYRSIARDRGRLAPLTLSREAAMAAPAQGAGQDGR